MDADLQQQLRSAVGKLDDHLQALHLRAPRQEGHGHNVSTMNVNAGGIGVWFCSAICLALLIGFFVAGFWVSREFSRIDAERVKQADVDSVQDAYIHKLRAERAPPPEH